ncbi:MULTISPECIES: DUF2726 domain-containing protein [Paracoccus]|uniref:DUF2726 domain-containing protein n=1 Tax=Paracoccus TaxID=265 RepID=UPI002582B16B|nr:DUF2726 domain-containing protein [Paracoccus sp. (in: a-proteobacteria)]
MEAFLTIFLIGVVAVLLFLGSSRKLRDKQGGYSNNQASYNRYSRPFYKASQWQSSQKPASSKVTVDEQLSALRATNVTAHRPINKSAYRVLLMIERTLRSEAPRARVLAEVGMGAFLSTRRQGNLTAEDKTAFGAFNSKRVDFLVINSFGEPCFAVEYHGSGHHLGNTAAERDVLKREALRLGGVELVEIHTHTSEDEALALLSGAVGRMNARPTVKATA